MGIFGKKKGDAMDLSGLPVISAAQVAQNNTPDSAWIIINGVVYDVTSWQESHPGGGDILLEHAGKDATEDFEDIGHSKDAKKRMTEFIVGKLG